MKLNVKLVVIVCLQILMVACNPKVLTTVEKSYKTTDYKQEVYVFELGQKTPDSVEIIGNLTISYPFINTTSRKNTDVDIAKLEARKIGGNAIIMKKHVTPFLWGNSGCQIIADIVRIKDNEHFFSNTESEDSSEIDYAIINVYRHKEIISFLSYDIYLGDSVICRVRNNFKTTLKIKKDGYNSLWARTEEKEEIPINIKIGETYYLRCGHTFGVLVDHPKLELIDNSIGKTEFESLNAEHQ